jgi:hypothetical protein
MGGGRKGEEQIEEEREKEGGKEGERENEHIYHAAECGHYHTLE